MAAEICKQILNDEVTTLNITCKKLSSDLEVIKHLFWKFLLILPIWFQAAKSDAHQYQRHYKTESEQLQKVAEDHNRSIAGFKTQLEEKETTLDVVKKHLDEARREVNDAKRQIERLEKNQRSEDEVCNDFYYRYAYTIFANDLWTNC